MTEKLYDQDAYLKQFQAVVMEARPAKSGYEIRLDRTAFYPEGGGQQGDTGFLETEDNRPTDTGTGLLEAEEDDGPADNGSRDGTENIGCPGTERIRVLDTREKGGEIWHITDRPLLPGQTVRGEINWDNRFERMQNHTGEHIVSGLIHKTFGYDNVGFHMGHDVLTIDLNGLLTWEQIREIEQKANEVVWKNVEVSCVTYPHNSAAEFSYRSKKEIEGDIRLVTIPGADICACCGTHVARTGEIGLIKLISVVKFHSGVRIEMLCGRPAYRYMRDIWEQNHEVSVLLSAKMPETAKAVSRMKDQAFQSQFRCTQLENERISFLAGQYKGHGNTLLIEQGMQPDLVRKLAAEILETCGGVSAVFSVKPDGGCCYAIGEKDGNVKELSAKINEKLQGRGGGKPFFVQGSVNASAEEVKEFFKKEWN